MFQPPPVSGWGAVVSGFDRFGGVGDRREVDKGCEDAEDEDEDRDAEGGVDA